MMEILYSNDSIIKALIDKAIILIFGIISFRIYERYRNKKDNSLLYIQLIKLEKELKNNKEIIENAINKNRKLVDLRVAIGIEGKSSKLIYELYDSISNLDRYLYSGFNKIAEDDFETYSDYRDKQYENIESIKNEIHLINTSNIYEHDKLKKYLDYLEEKIIYKDLEDIEDGLKKLILEELSFSRMIDPLYSAICKYNKLSLEEREKYLDKFCKMILEDDGEINIPIKKFHMIKQIEREIKYENKINIRFELWQSIDIEMLALYDVEAYLYLEGIYEEYRHIEIDILDDEKLKYYQLIMGRLEGKLKEERYRIKEVLDKTQFLFRGI